MENTCLVEQWTCRKWKFHWLIPYLIGLPFKSLSLFSSRCTFTTRTNWSRQKPVLSELRVVVDMLPLVYGLVSSRGVFVAWSVQFSDLVLDNHVWDMPLGDFKWLSVAPNNCGSDINLYGWIAGQKYGSAWFSRLALPRSDSFIKF